MPIGGHPISLTNLVICFSAWLLGPKFGTLSVAALSGTGRCGSAGVLRLRRGHCQAGRPTGGYLVGYLLLAFIGGLFIEKSNGSPVVSGIGLVLGDAACYVLGTAWFVFQMQCDLLRAGGLRLSLHCTGPRQKMGGLPASWVHCCASVWYRLAC